MTITALITAIVVTIGIALTALLACAPLLVQLAEPADSAADLAPVVPLPTPNDHHLAA